MNRCLLITATLLTGLAVWCADPAGFSVSGPVVPKHAADEYPTHLAEYGQGGLHSVSNSAARDAIPSLRRKAGMLVWVADEDRRYRLDSTLTNWVVDMDGPGAAIQVRSLAALIALPTAGLPDGAYAETVERDPGYGGGLKWRLDKASEVSTNRGTVAMASDGGRWVAVGREWNLLAFGVRSDGTPQTEAVQDAIDYLAQIATDTGVGGSYEEVRGGVLRIPWGQAIISGTLDVKRGLTMIGDSGPGVSPYPRMTPAPWFIKAPGTSGPLLRAVDYTNHLGNWDTPSGVRLENIVFHGNYDAQDTNDLSSCVLYINSASTAAKTWVIRGCTFTGAPGWALFNLGGLGASWITDTSFLGPTFTTVMADLNLSGVDFADRDLGVLSETSPGGRLPTVWLSSYSQKSTYSSVRVYYGPDWVGSGTHRELANWSIASYDGTADTITLSSTNGLFDGIPVRWKTGGTLPTGVDPNETYHILWSGTPTVQIASIANYWTRTPLNFSGGSASADRLQCGEPATVVMNGAGNTQNTMLGWRVEDSYAHLLTMHGVFNNTWVAPEFNFSYSSNGVFVLGEDCENIQFIGGKVSYETPLPPGTEAPIHLITWDANSRGNRLIGTRVIGSTSDRIIDLGTTDPVSHSDYEMPSTLLLRGNVGGIRFEDAGDGTNRMWFDANSILVYRDDGDTNTSVPDQFDWGFLGAPSDRLEVHGTNAPSVSVVSHGVPAGYASLQTGHFGGTRSAATATPAGPLGHLYGFGHDGNAVTPAQVSVDWWTPSLWNPGSLPTEIGFSVTDTGQTTRREVLRIGKDGNLNWTNAAPLLTAKSTNGASGLRINVLGGSSEVLRLQNNGTTILQADTNASATTAGLLIWTNNGAGSGGSTRVRVGATGSGPSGSGRALYVD